MAHKSSYVVKAFKLLAAITFILFLCPILGIHLPIIKGGLWFSMFINTILFLAIGWYIEEYTYETLSSTQQEKRYKNLTSLRNCILVCAIILLYIIANELKFV